MTRLFVSVLAALAFSSYAAVPVSEAESRVWCDETSLSPVEGIWEYTSEDIKVLVKEDPMARGVFSIYVIDTPDCRLEPGDVIGKLHSTVDSRQFRLEQMTRKGPLGLFQPKDCAASLSSDGESLRVKSPKVKLKIMPYTLLPRFWRLIRLSEKNPTEDLPVGLVKIYPGYDRNGSLRRKPRIL